jgi:transcriptional regulator with XRE-family HTH domain
VPETIALRVDRLKALREEHGLSQRELSGLCGLGTSAIGTYERGEVDPSSKHLKMIAEKLGVSTDYLLGLSDDPVARFGASEINDDERAVVQALRRGGWPAVIRVVADRMTG